MELNLYTYNKDYSIIGIDPGSNLGVSVIIVDGVTNKIKDVITNTIYLNASINNNVIVDRLNYLRSYLEAILSYYNPVSVCMEAVFMHRFPQAVIQLSQYTAFIESTIYNYNPYIRFFKLAPKLIKRLICTGDAKKDDMAKALSKIKELKKFLSEDKTEHEYDSLAMAYIAYCKIKEHPELLFMDLGVSL